MDSRNLRSSPGRVPLPQTPHIPCPSQPLISHQREQILVSHGMVQGCMQKSFLRVRVPPFPLRMEVCGAGVKETRFLSGSFVGQLPTPPDDPCHRVSRNLCCWTRVHVLLSKALSPEEVVQSLCYRFTLFPQVKGNTFMCVVNIFFVKDIIVAYHEPTVSFQKHPC